MYGLSLGLKHLNVDISGSLFHFKGKELFLNGLKMLGRAEAKVLRTFRWDYLYLNGLQSLSDETAVAFSRFRLNGISLRLTDLQYQGVPALAKVVGPIFMNQNCLWASVQEVLRYK